MKSRPRRPLTQSSFEWGIIFLATLFCWNQSTFQFNLYWATDDISSGLLVLTQMATMLGMLFGIMQKVPRPLFRLVIGYLLLCLIFSGLVLMGGRGDLFFYLKAMVFAVLMFWIIGDEFLLKGFIGLNFWMGFVLILLNSVTVFHWVGWIDLPYETVRRVGGGLEQYRLDPVHFGLFGMTENHIDEGSYTGTPRLQGWSSEPLHWSYFVLLTAASAFLLLARSRETWVKRFLALAIGVIATHLYFVQSTTATLSAVAAISIMVVFAFLQRISTNGKTILWTMFLALVLLPGVLLPFLLLQVPNIEHLFLSERIFGEGGNWARKIDFLQMGSNLYFLFLPNSSTPSASHNFVLGKYLEGGYLFLIPLLGFLFLYLRSVIDRRFFWLACAATVAVIANTLTVESAFFYPSGAMWLLMVSGTAFYLRRKRDSAGD